MSNKHSLGAYRILVQARSSKSILVEGKDDKELLLKIKLARYPKGFFVVDSADILSDKDLCGLGAKASLDMLLASIKPEAHVLDKLRCIVDREWETLVDGDSNPVEWTPPICTKSRIATDGHSIENYSFVENFVETYLHHFGGGLALPKFMTDVAEAVPELVRYAAAFSEVARKHYAIGRCTGLFDAGDIRWDGSRVSPQASLLKKMEARQVDEPANFIDAVNFNYNEKWRNSEISNSCQLHAHGHIGEEILWAGIGSIASSHGHNNSTVREISNGRRDERKRVWHTWLVQQDDEYISSLTLPFTS